MLTILSVLFSINSYCLATDWSNLDIKSLRPDQVMLPMDIIYKGINVNNNIKYSLDILVIKIRNTVWSDRDIWVNTIKLANDISEYEIKINSTMILTIDAPYGNSMLKGNPSDPDSWEYSYMNFILGLYKNRIVIFLLNWEKKENIISTATDICESGLSYSDTDTIWLYKKEPYCRNSQDRLWSNNLLNVSIDTYKILNAHK